MLSCHIWKIYVWPIQTLIGTVYVIALLVINRAYETSQLPAWCRPTSVIDRGIKGWCHGPTEQSSSNYVLWFTWHGGQDQYHWIRAQAMHLCELSAINLTYAIYMSWLIHDTVCALTEGETRRTERIWQTGEWQKSDGVGLVKIEETSSGYAGRWRETSQRILYKGMKHSTLFFCRCHDLDIILNLGSMPIMSFTCVQRLLWQLLKLTSRCAKSIIPPAFICKYYLRNIIIYDGNA